MNNMSGTILSFDIETVPDAEAVRAMHGFSAAVSDAEAVAMAQRLRRQQGRSDFLPRACQQVVVIGCALRHSDGAQPFRVFSLSPPEYDEAAAIAMFFKIIEKYTPQLVSWNGGSFDLPVLHYRGMRHGIVAERYWQTGGNDISGDKFRWNNYISRYHERHLDLMDALAMYSPGAWARLDDVARLCGLPGKIGIGGKNVYAAWQEGRQREIADYCEADALLTYLLYLRFQHFRGRLPSLAEEYEIVRQHLDGAQWQEFLQQWVCD